MKIEDDPLFQRGFAEGLEIGAGAVAVLALAALAVYAVFFS